MTQCFCWLRVRIKKMVMRFVVLDSYCECCGRKNHDFVVSDELWLRVVPTPLRGVLCYDCFSQKASQVGLLGVWKLVELE
mgnify:CR=1 FL=1